MKTSRKQGILALKVEHGYQVAVDGTLQKRDVVICKEFTGAEDGVALDIEQAIMGAMSEVFQKQNQAKAKKEDAKEVDDFFNNDSPNEKQVADAALVIEMALNASKAVKVSEFLELFGAILDAGLIETDSGAKIHRSTPLWVGMHRYDKMKIAYSYCAFFANPLARLSDTASSKGGK